MAENDTFSNSPNLSLDVQGKRGNSTYWQTSLENNSRTLDTLCQTVVAGTLNDSSSTTLGISYLVGDTPAGNFATFAENDIATYYSSGISIEYTGSGSVVECIKSSNSIAITVDSTSYATINLVTYSTPESVCGYLNSLDFIAKKVGSIVWNSDSNDLADSTTDVSSIGIILSDTTSNTGWVNFTPLEGWTLYDTDAAVPKAFSSGTWSSTALTGTSGYSGYSGIKGDTGTSGYSGYSGGDGMNGASGASGYSGYSGSTGTSGTSGTSGYSGYSGLKGDTGTSGYSGIKGDTGNTGASGTSGYSGATGDTGDTGTSGYSGYSGSGGATGTSGYSGIKGDTGNTGTSGYSGKSGYSGSASTYAPGGSTNQIQYYGAGPSFQGDYDLRWDSGTNTMDVTGTINSTNIVTTGDITVGDDLTVSGGLINFYSAGTLYSQLTMYGSNPCLSSYQWNKDQYIRTYTSSGGANYFKFDHNGNTTLPGTLDVAETVEGDNLGPLEFRWDGTYWECNGQDSAGFVMPAAGYIRAISMSYTKASASEMLINVLVNATEILTLIDSTTGSVARQEVDLYTVSDGYTFSAGEKISVIPSTYTTINPNTGAILKVWVKLDTWAAVGSVMTTAAGDDPGSGSGSGEPSDGSSDGC